MYEAMTAAFEGANAHGSVRCVLIAGVPGAFSAGNDLTEILKLVGMASPQTSCFTWRRLVAQGSLTAAGSGEEVVPASDYRALQNQIPAEAGPVPTPDDRDGLEDRWKPSIQLDQEQAIPICALSATAHPPLQHDQLMTERRVLCLKSALRLEGRDEQGQEETEQRDHRG